MKLRKKRKQLKALLRLNKEEFPNRLKAKTNFSKVPIFPAIYGKKSESEWKKKIRTEVIDENIDKVFESFLAAIPEIKALAFISLEGLHITSSLPFGSNVVKIAGITSMLLKIADMMSIEVKASIVEELYINSSNGFLFVLPVDSNSLLVVSTSSSNKIDQIYFKCKQFCKKIRDLHEIFVFKKRFCNLKNDFGDVYKPIESQIKEIELLKEVTIMTELELKLKTDNFYYLLKCLLKGIPEMKGAVLNSTEGVPIASILPQEIDEAKITAMSAICIKLAKMLGIETKNGEIDRLNLIGLYGYVFILPTGSDTLLTISLARDANVGEFLLNIERMRNLKDSNSKDGDKDDTGAPYPYIFKPPHPPDDIAPVGQVQAVKLLRKEKSEHKQYCKHCGSPHSRGQSICHVCKNKI